MRSPLLDLPGATGTVVADHYGNPLAESKSFSSGEAWVDCSDWQVIRVAGPDRLIWLDSISSQELASLPPQTTAESLVLDPQGHVEHRFLLMDDGESAWLLTEPGTAPALVAWLEKMRFRMQVDIADHTDQFAVIAAVQPPDISAEVRWVDSWPAIGPGAVGYGPDPHPGDGEGVTFFAVPRDTLAAGMHSPWAGVWALHAHLIAAGRPLLADVDNKSLPHEWDWLRTAVHLNKGCYRGQETVAKIHNLGHPPRRAVIFHLDGSDGSLPELGADVVDGDAVIGQITRVARHHELGSIGIGLVKRKASSEDVVVRGIDGPVAARTQQLTSPEAGAARRQGLRSR